MNIALFKDVFRDAHVIDLDFSDWDQAVRLVVVAVEATAFPKRRLPLYVVEFKRVRTLNVTFAHYGARLEFGHFQWKIDEAIAEEIVQGWRVTLSGSKHLPATMIECDDIDIRSIDNESLDRLFPGWSRPGSPFARPGIEVLAKETVAGRGKQLT